MYGLPKIHKKDLPLRPIVSGNGSVFENCAKHLALVLNSVKGKNPHSIKNSIDFVEKIKDLEVPPGYKMVSFDVSALFTSIPIDLALTSIRSKLVKDPSWRTHTELSLEQVMTLLELCLSNTYFVFRGTFYQQKFGAPMGSPISPAVADLCMEVFEEEMLAACPPHLQPKIWVRYVDDTFSVLHMYAIEDFTTYLNSINEHIQFTREIEEEPHSSNDATDSPVSTSDSIAQLPFLDVEAHKLEDGSLKTKVYRKPTHTDQYLNWDSGHHLDHKRSVVRTLLNRVETHVSDPADRQAEIQHVHSVLKANGYKDWALKIPNQKDKEARKAQKQLAKPPDAPRKPSVGLPYVQGLSEELQRIFASHGVNVFHKPFNTLRQALVHPKDKTETKDKCGAIYHIPCGTCDDFYIGETSRKMGVRFKEHLKSDKESAVLDHVKATGHSFSFEDVSILAREAYYAPRKTREALEIHKYKPQINKDAGWIIPPVMLDLLPAQDPTTIRGPGRVGPRNRVNSL